ncbi:MAG: hypothetical protein CMA64_07100 [Euryarchaeota archaeon]|nr:hypothetical protein [Euryarchaeota archaeon]
MTPVLYILMRTDLDSMNPGKAMAQASHASNAFVHNAEPGYNVDEELFNAWQQSTTQGFGTVLVLGVTEAQMRTAVEVAGSFGVDKFPCGIVHDPTYPLQDGDTTHSIPLDTCGYIFGEKDDLKLQAILQNFELCH